jgi:hypothetical protein
MLKFGIFHTPSLHKFPYLPSTLQHPPDGMEYGTVIEMPVEEAARVLKDTPVAARASCYAADGLCPLSR